MRKFVEPCAIVRDLGSTMASAVEEAVGKIVHKPCILACHFHFLCNISIDRLSDDYDHLRKLVRSLSVCENIRVVVKELRRKVDADDISCLYEEFDTWIDLDDVSFLQSGDFGMYTIRVLGQWILDYSHDGNDLGFPFDRPCLDLYQRCKTVNKSIRVFLDQMRFDYKVDKGT